MPPEHVDDYYDILGIPYAATTKGVTANYRSLAKLRHPDMKMKGGSTSAFQLLVKAHETLKDPTERTEYNKIWPEIRDRLRRQSGFDRFQADTVRDEGRTKNQASAKGEKEHETRKRSGKDAGREEKQTEDEARTTKKDEYTARPYYDHATQRREAELREDKQEEDRRKSAEEKFEEDEKQRARRKEKATDRDTEDGEEDIFQKLKRLQLQEVQNEREKREKQEEKEGKANRNEEDDIFERLKALHQAEVQKAREQRDTQRRDR